MTVSTGRNNDLFSFRGNLRTEDLLQRFEQLTQLVGDCVFETDSFGCLSWVSDKAMDVFGRPSVLLRGQKLHAFGQFIDQDLEDLHPDWREANRNLMFRLDAFRGAAPRILEMNILPVFDPVDGHFTGSRGTARDITDHWESLQDRHLREDLVHALKKLQPYSGNGKSWVNSIQKMLRELRQTLKADRVYVQEVFGGLAPMPTDGICVIQDRASVAEDINPELRLDQPCFMGWTVNFRAQRSIYVDAAEDNMEIAAMLRRRNIREMFALPLFADARWWGLLVIERGEGLKPLAVQQRNIIENIGSQLTTHFDQYRSERCRELLENRYRQSVHARGETILVWQFDTGHVDELQSSFDFKRDMDSIPTMNMLAGDGPWHRLQRDLAATGTSNIVLGSEDLARSGLGLNDACRLVSHMETGGRVVTVLHRDAGNHASDRQGILIDPVTGLGNKTRFFDRMHEVCDQPVMPGKRPERVLAYISVCGFGLLMAERDQKIVPPLLQQISDRIRHHFGALAMTGYLGNGRFGVFASTESGQEQFLARLVSFCAECHDGISVADKDNLPRLFSLSLALCRALYPQQPAGDIIDTANILARHAGGHVVSGQGNATTQPGMIWACNDGPLEDRLKKRLARRRMIASVARPEQLRMRWQPVVDLSTGQPVSFEALMATDSIAGMDHVTARDVFTGSDTAELVQSLANVTVERAMDLFGVMETGKVPKLSLNLARSQLLDPGLPELLESALANAGARADRVILEIQEADIAVAGIRDILTGLYNSGYAIHVDDFGSCEGSLGLLDLVFVHGIKINAATWMARAHTPTRGRASLEALTGFCAKTGIAACARNIEKAEQAAFARNCGFTSGQGWFHGMALDLPEVPDWMRMNEQDRARLKLVQQS